MTTETWTSGSCTCTLDDSTGIFTVTGNGAMENYTTSNPPWMNSTIRSIIISQGVTSIGDSSFIHCSSLTSVSISDTVVTIGNSAFRNCTALASISIPASVTNIGLQVFEYCDSLTSISVSEENTAYMSEDGVLFNKTKTTLIQYPCAKTDTSYPIPDTVVTIGNSAFNYSKYLTSMTIPDSVTSIEGSAFESCSKLASITLGNSVTSIGSHAFERCHKLTSLTIPDSVTTIGARAFDSCTSIASVTIGKSVSSIGLSAFSQCDSLVSITVDSDNASYLSEDGVLFNKSKTQLVSYPIGNTRNAYTIPDSVTSIEGRAFKQCTTLELIVIPASVTTIGAEVFFGCVSINKFIFFATSWNISIGSSAFSLGATSQTQVESTVSSPDNIADGRLDDYQGTRTVFSYMNLESYKYIHYDDKQCAVDYAVEQGSLRGILPVANGGTGSSSVDTTPVSGSTRMVTSDGIYHAIQTPSGLHDWYGTLAVNTYYSLSTVFGASSKLDLYGRVYQLTFDDNRVPHRSMSGILAIRDSDPELAVVQGYSLNHLTVGENPFLINIDIVFESESTFYIKAEASRHDQSNTAWYSDTPQRLRSVIRLR